MGTELLISSDPWENRVALLEDGKLAEIYYEREERVIGSIYKGKVQNVLPGMGASFIDIGLGRNAFLYVDDINKAPLNIGDVEITQGRSGYTIGEKVERGDEVLVQIVKEPRGLKGARVSTNISLPGRYLILMPTGKYSGVSRKIDSADERNRLKGIMKLIRPEGMATVVRTAAANVSQAELIADLGVLIRMWHGILESYKRAPAPALIHKDMNLIYKAARDFITPEVERVLIDDGDECEKVKDFMRLLGPQYVERIEHYTGGRALFGDFKVEDEVHKLMRPKVELPSGGSIVIESTEALTVIDVNSGKFTGGRNLEDTIVKTNIEAAAEIARQVRLRDIGGIIVCDFIDMNSEASRTKVVETLKAGLVRDRTRTTIQSFSALGLLEFTRKRIGKDLGGQLRGACPTCRGLGSVMSAESVAIEAFREVRQFAHAHQNGKHPATIEVHAAPTVGAQLEYWNEDEMLGLQRSLEAKIAVRVDETLHPERLRVGEPETLAKAIVKPSTVRVGDEFDVELLTAKLPTPTSALAVVAGRLVEVENAAGAIGRAIKIKVIDVDDDGSILAEPRSPVDSGEELRKRRRRRGGRGRSKPLTVAEQAEELRELAEEASKGLDSRPPIGISTATEPEDVESRLKALPLRRGTPAGAPPAAAPAVVTPIGVADPIGAETVIESGENGAPRRRRRRRRRGRGGIGTEAALAGIPLPSAAAQVAEAPTAVAGEFTGGVGGLEPATVGEDGVVRRRRRRRRRRGRGGVGPEGAPVLQAVPDRHIFRAGTGGVEATGKTAPPEPSRAIAPRIDRPAHVAVEPPPPSLRLVAEAPKLAKPTRRRRTTGEDVVDASPAVKPIAALPAAKAETEPKPRGRRKAVVDATPKRTVRKPATAKPTTAAAAPKAPARRKKADGEPAATAPARRLTSATTTARKKIAAKKTARKKSP
ncbi:MAG: Rne/Rng family ribonuclease [Vulcanimicrobiaceae bacterium]